MRLSQGLKPRRDARWDVGLIGRPPPHKPIVAFQNGGKAPLRPSQRGQTLG